MAQTNKGGVFIERTPNSPRDIIDPHDPDAQRRFQIKKRGGAYSDRVRIDPFAKAYSGRTKRKSRKRA